MSRGSLARTRIVVSLGLLGFALVAGAGTAAAEKKRVGVPKFDGAQEAIVRKKVMQVLKGEGYELVKSREIDAAASSAGASLDSNDGFKAIAKELSLSAFVTGEVGKKKAKLTVRNGADGSVSGEGSFAGVNPRKIAAEVGKSFMRRLGSAIDRGKPPSGAKKPQKAAVAEAPEDNEETPEAGGDEETEAKPSGGGEKSETVASNEGDEGKKKKKKKKEEAAEEEESGPTGPLPGFLDAAIGGRAFTRKLSYNQDVNKALRQYQLAVGPAVVANIIFYPGALATNSFVANIGVELDLEQAIGITSKVGTSPAFPMGATFPTTIHDFGLAARLRIPVNEMFQVAALVGGGEHAFSFRSGTEDRGLLDIPDTIYRYVRAGAEARVTVAPGFSIIAGAGYRYILNKAGQISDPIFFPHLTVGGVDAELKVAYRVTPMIEVRVGGELRRYFYAMHSVMADVGTSSIAGGAVDQYISGTAQIAFMLGGESGGGGGGASEEAAPPPKKEKSEKKDKDSGDSGGDSGE
jgi:hypothetical protein